MADTSKAPERIWLQEPVGLEYERSWCAEQQSDDDTPYIRADLYDAARAEVDRLTAALADAETRGAERMLPLINAAAGATTAIAHALDDGDVADNSAGNLEASLSALNSALEPPIRALPLPPRERDGQEGGA